MSGNTHLVIGTVLGVLAYKYIPNLGFIAVPCSMFGSLLPDIDIRYSIMSQTLHFTLPFEHRGFTHSFLCMLIIFVIMCNINFGSAAGLFIGMLSHSFCDMFTGKGVRLLYPFSKKYRFKLTLNL